MLRVGIGTKGRCWNLGGIMMESSEESNDSLNNGIGA